MRRGRAETAGGVMDVFLHLRPISVTWFVVFATPSRGRSPAIRGQYSCWELTRLQLLLFQKTVVELVFIHPVDAAGV